MQTKLLPSLPRVIAHITQKKRIRESSTHPAMLARVWHGWTHATKADAYERLLLTQVFPDMASRGIPGYRGIDLLRRDLGAGEVEFVTVMWFDSEESAAHFAGDECELAIVPPEAQRLLVRYFEVSRHYEVRESARFAYQETNDT